jgi:small subunit ribosomal protein S17
LLQKTIRKSKKYRAHDENNTFNVGDQVRIQECAPKSKTKRWEVLSAEA